MKAEKTNAMRQLERKKLEYRVHTYEGGALSGTQVASALGQAAERVFKTLVTVGKTGQHYVFMVPVARELHLKKAAAAVGEKSVAMIAQKELLPLTGYVHGGCSPIRRSSMPPRRRTGRSFSAAERSVCKSKPRCKLSGRRCRWSFGILRTAIDKRFKRKYNSLEKPKGVYKDAEKYNSLSS